MYRSGETEAPMRDEREPTPTRREFLATAAAIGAPLLVSPRVVRGSEASSRSWTAGWPSLASEDWAVAWWRR